MNLLDSQDVILVVGVGNGFTICQDIPTRASCAIDGHRGEVRIVRAIRAVSYWRLQVPKGLTICVTGLETVHCQQIRSEHDVSKHPCDLLGGQSVVIIRRQYSGVEPGQPLAASVENKVSDYVGF